MVTCMYRTVHIMSWIWAIQYRPYGPYITQHTRKYGSHVPVEKTIEVQKSKMLTTYLKFPNYLKINLKSFEKRTQNHMKLQPGVVPVFFSLLGGPGPPVSWWRRLVATRSLREPGHVYIFIYGNSLFVSLSK